MAGRAVIAIALVLTGAIPQTCAATSLRTISGDPNNFFIPDLFSTVDPVLQTVTEIGTLGNGTYAFNGGLTVGPGGLLYGIGNDSSGAGSLFSIQPNGAFSVVGAFGGLGDGFLGGLTFDPVSSTFYAAVLDSQGNTTLSRITTGGVAVATGQNLGTGFSGLALDTASGLFYGIGNDITGFSTLYDFQLGGAPNFVASLGFGFGALSYDPANNAFWAISPVNNASSLLYQISPAGAESNPFLTLGDGFAGLAVEPAAAPEPPAAATIAAGLVLVFWISKRQRRRNQ